MEIVNFQALDHEGQWDEFWENARKLADYQSIEHRYSLYSLHGFLVELTFDGFSGTTMCMNAFLDGPRLDKYVDELSDFAEQLKRRK